jgi:hypothetical protein
MKARSEYDGNRTMESTNVTQETPLSLKDNGWHK